MLEANDWKTTFRSQAAVEAKPNGVRRAGHPGFLAVLDEIRALHEKKATDYGSDADPFANVRASEEFGIDPWLGAILRANDKVTRLKTYAHKGSLANESVEDSLIDLASYAVIGLVLFREGRKEAS